MKNYGFLFSLLFSTLTALAQTPTNDDCSPGNIVALGNAPVCPTTVFTNVGATASDIGFSNKPSCATAAPARDVWFKFTCPDTLFDFRITVSGTGAGSILQPQFAVYRGTCTTNDLAEFACTEFKTGATTTLKDVIGLTAGAEYFIRVWDYSQNATPKSGTFLICVDKLPPVFLITEGSSTLPSGSLVDSGGPDGTHDVNENEIFEICPPTSGGTQCISFVLEYYHFDYTPGIFWENGKDKLAFYEGKSTAANDLIVQINGDDLFDPKIVAGSGGVCFMVQTEEPCMTVKFTSDAKDVNEGFLGHWTTTAGGCPQTATLQLADADNLLIANALTTPFSQVSNIQINCPTGAAATFSVPTDNSLAMKKGLVLTSGQADLVFGPNKSGVEGEDNFADGDTDLDYLSDLENGDESLDACIVEMDVFVATDQLSFEYVFGSEEYPEFVNQDYNDIFAFLISGPGIVGDPNLTNSAKNIAIIPSTSDPVQINSVNQIQNWQFYRNNEVDQFLQYDGLTSDKFGVKKTLTARSTVQPCQTYHLKLAVADRADGVYDSGVFISEIGGGTPEVVAKFASGIDYFVENCSGDKDEIVVQLSNPIDKDVNLSVSISGTATLGVDYTLAIPAVVTIPAGETSKSFPIVPIADLLPEGTETVVITLSNNFGCGDVTYKSLVLEIKDDVEVDAGPDATICGNFPFKLNASGAVSYFWEPVSLVSNAFVADPTVSLSQTTTFKVTGSVGACSDVDSVTLTVINLDLKVSALDSTKICLGENVPLLAVGTGGLPNLKWEPADGLNDPTIANPIATPTKTTTYVASISDANCTLYDSITIFVDTLFFPKLASDTVICQLYPMVLGEDLNATSTQFSWTPASTLDDPTASNPTANPDFSTIYTLTATSANGYCTQTGSINIQVKPSAVQILGPDTIEVCYPTSGVLLTANAEPAGASVVRWSPPFTVNPQTGNQVLATPDETTTYIATYEVDGCVAYDSVYIRVDSLPEGLIKLQPVKQIYCPGDTIYMISKTYEPASFPDIELQWEQFGQMLTPDSFWNMVILASETHIYKRTMTNRACSRVDSVEVPVGVIPDIQIVANPPGYCPGGSTQITVSINPSADIEWDDTPGLSCKTCLNPTANPSQTTFYSLKTVNEPCPANAGILVEVYPLPQFNVVDKQVCFGGNTLLQNVPQSNTAYSWSTVPPSAFTSSLANPTSPNLTQNTTFQVTALTDKGCSGSRTVKVDVIDAQVNAGADQIICTGQNVTLNATQTGNATGTIVWEGPPNPANNPNTFPVTGNADYKAILNYGPGCIDIDTVRITALPAPLLNVPADKSICRGQSVKLNDVLVTSTQYVWTVTPAGANPTGANPTVAPTSTSTYSVVATTAQGCSLTDEIKVEVAFAEVNAGADKSVCAGDEVILDATQTGTEGTFTWQFGNGSDPIKFPATSTTTFVVRLDYGPGCVDTDAVRITVLPVPSIATFVVKPDTTGVLCEGTPLSLKITTLPATGLAIKWFEKIDDGEFKELTETSTTLIPSPGIREGKATYKVEVTNSGGCSDEDEKTFEFKKCLEVPNAFTPNGDMVNDDFGVVQFDEDQKFEIEEFKVYSRWGLVVFNGSKTQPRWNGKRDGDGKDLPMDTYYFTIKVKLVDGQVVPFDGEVTLLR